MLDSLVDTSRHPSEYLTGRWGLRLSLDRSPLNLLKKVILTFTLDKDGLAPPPCGGQTLNFTIERTTSHALRKLDLAPIHLADYQF